MTVEWVQWREALIDPPTLIHIKSAKNDRSLFSWNKRRDNLKDPSRGWIETSIRENKQSTRRMEIEVLGGGTPLSILHALSSVRDRRESVVNGESACLARMFRPRCGPRRQYKRTSCRPWPGSSSLGRVRPEGRRDRRGRFAQTWPQRPWPGDRSSHRVCRTRNPPSSMGGCSCRTWRGPPSRVRRLLPR
ncbi:hypothetical protein PENTCL1PPCAC_3792, partial [Pristionchus entomophagus]